MGSFAGEVSLRREGMNRLGSMNFFGKQSLEHILVRFERARVLKVSRFDPRVSGLLKESLHA
jgi:hypothetical protein